MSDKDQVTETEEGSEKSEEEQYADLFEDVAKAKTKEEDLVEPDGDKSDVKKAEPDSDKKDESGKKEQTSSQAEETDDKKLEDAEKKGEDQTKDWRSSLSDTARKQLEDVERKYRLSQHKLKSDEGRVSGLQKKINALEASAAKKVQAGTPKEFTMPEIKTDEDFKKFEEDYPKIVKMVKQYADAVGKAVLETQVPSKQEDTEVKAPEAEKVEEQRKHEAELDRALTREIPNYKLIIQHSFFNKFIEDQPTYIQALAQSDDLEDLVALFKDHYDPYFRKHFPPKQKDSDKPGDKGNSADKEKQDDSPTDTKKADDVSKRREATLKDTAVDTKHPRDLSREEDTTEGNYDALFNKAAKEKNKQRLGII